ncbi:MAG: radical SAM protein, partial [Verrucomicrobiales bacterium]
AGLARLLEPRASSPNARLRAIRMLAEAGIPVGVSAAPIIPGLNDHEIPQILKAAALHGARHAFYTVVRLPYAVKEVFAGWLGEHFPDRKDKVLRRIEDLRGGRLNSAKFGSRMTGEGPAAAEIKRLFSVAARHAGLNRETPRLSTAAFRVPGRGEQLSFGF